MPTEMKLSVRYLGLDVDRGRMRATDIGPAIIGLSKMISQTSKILYGDETKVTVEVEADFEHGSFGIEFFAVSQAPDLFPSLSSDQLLAIAKTLGLIGGSISGVAGVIKILRWLGGHRPDKVSVQGNQTIITQGDKSLTININEFKAVSDPEIRRGLRALIDPMEREGIDALEIATEHFPPERIERQERDNFTGTVLVDEDVSKDVSRAILEVVSPTFREHNKWRFAQGDVPFYAEVLDEAFLERVARHEIVFGKGDALKVEMEIETTRIEGELRFTRRIVRVLEHISALEGDQLSLKPES